MKMIKEYRPPANTTRSPVRESEEGGKDSAQEDPPPSRERRDEILREAGGRTRRKVGAASKQPQGGAGARRQPKTKKARRNEGRVREQSDRDPKGREGTVERGPKPRYSFWPKQGSGQGERMIRLGQAPDTTQDQYNRPREERKEAFKEIREKLEAEKDKEVRGVLKRRKKIHDMKKDLDQGSGGEYRQVHMESIERDQKYCREHEGMVVGLVKAIAIVEIEEEKQNQQGHTPQPRSRPAHNKPRKIPQMLQRSTEGEGSLAGEMEEGESQIERKTGGPKSSKERKEAKGTSRAPLRRTERGSPSNRNAKIVGNNQKEEPTREDPQAQGQPATKEG